MRVFIPSLLLLAIVVFFIPGEKCTKKLQVTGLFFLVAAFAFTVFRESYYFDCNLKDLLLLDVDRMDGRLSMLAVYIMALCNVIVFLKSTFYRLKLTKNQ